MGDLLCPACRLQNLGWDSDADAEDAGYAVKGIISFYHCTKCGTEVEIFIPDENPYEQEGKQ